MLYKLSYRNERISAWQQRSNNNAAKQYYKNGYRYGPLVDVNFVKVSDEIEIKKFHKEFETQQKILKSIILFFVSVYQQKIPRKRMIYMMSLMKGQNI